MVYLIESGEFYKIGYTKDLMERLSSYNTDNPNIKVLDIIESATRKEEKQLQELLSDYKYNGEWFYKDMFILKIWKAYKKTFNPDNYAELIKKIDNLESQIKSFIYIENDLLSKQTENLRKLTENSNLT